MDHEQPRGQTGLWFRSKLNSFKKTKKVSGKKSDGTEEIKNIKIKTQKNQCRDRREKCQLKNKCQKTKNRVATEDINAS